MASNWNDSTKRAARVSKMAASTSASYRLVDIPVSGSDVAGNMFLRLCSLLSWATAAAASMAVILDCILLLSARLEAAEATLHCFGIPMAMAVVLAEREVSFLLKRFSFLESWFFKGFYISFIGTLLMAFKHDLQGLNAQDLWRTLLGSYLIGTGILYVVLGALCFRQLRAYQLSKIRRKKAMRQEVASLNQQKQQIEKLLADTESRLELL